MAKNKFQLNKGGDHNFDISKGGKRKFDLTKDDDEPIVSATNINVSQPINPANPEPDENPSGGSKKWIWIILAAVVIAVLAWLFITGNSDSVPENAITESEVVPVDSIEETPTPVEEVAVEENVDETVPAQGEEVATSSESNPEIVETPSSSSTTSTFSSTPISDNIEYEALRVIRGDYGIGQERRNNLGDKYQAIQKRVNELKRQGAF